MTSTSNDQEAVKVLHTNNNNSLLLCRDSTPSCCMSRLEVTSTGTFSRPAF